MNRRGQPREFRKGRGPRRGIDITFIVAHRREEGIEECVASVRRALPPGVRAELIGVVGNRPSKQRNIAVAKAKGDILHFLDNDSLLDPKAVSVGLRLLRKNPKAAIVGGPSLTPPTDSFFQRLFGLVLSSSFAVGRAVRSRYAAVGPRRRAGEYELILCNLMIRAEVFRRVGGFDETMYPNEENILINRILRLGYEAWYDPAMAVYRSQRRTWGEFIRQLFTYGRGRADQLDRDPKSFRPFQLIPPAFFLYALTTPLLAAIVGRGWLLPWGVYIILNLFFSLRTAIFHWRGEFLPWLPPLFFCVHFFYGAGMVFGALRNLLARLGWPKPEVRISCGIDHVVRF